MFLMQKRRFWLVEMEVCYSVCKLNMGVCTHCSRLWWITEVLQTSLFYLVAPRFLSLFFLTSACKWRSWLIWLFVRNYCLALCLFFMRKIETERGCYEWIKGECSLKQNNHILKTASRYGLLCYKTCLHLETFTILVPLVTLFYSDWKKKKYFLCSLHFALWPCRVFFILLRHYFRKNKIKHLFPYSCYSKMLSSSKLHFRRISAPVLLCV